MTPLTPRTSARRTWFLVGGIFTIAVLGLGVFVAWQLISGTGFGQQTRQSSFTSPGTPETVHVRGTSAAVELNGAQTGDVLIDTDLTWYVGEPVVDASPQGSDLVVDLSCQHTEFPIWFAPGCDIDFAAELPQSAGVNAAVTTGSLTVQAVEGDAEFITTAGSIDATELSGDAIEATATSGNITLDFAESADHIAAETTQGNVEITVPRGRSYQVLTDSTHGTADVQVTTDPEADAVIDVTTSSGDITVRYAD